MTETQPLIFKYHPLLADALPFVSLGQYPTPVEQMTDVGDALGLDRLYVKRDDQTGAVYGGNKVRKLEFLLADALRNDAKEVITIGFDGSNHALATAIYAQQLGLKSISMLLPQAPAHYVRRNLLASHYFGAELRHYANLASLSSGMVSRTLKGKLKHGVAPAYIPAGGSSRLGVVGYVNAALELKEQIDARLLPEPDVVYVPLGSMGTSVGLALGLRLAGLKTRVVAIRVIEEKMASAKKAVGLYNKAALALAKIDPAFSRFDEPGDDHVIRNEFMGPGYAQFTEGGVEASKLMNEKAGITMNGAYSAKAFAALMSDAREGKLKGKVVLFWNTYNSRDLSPLIKDVDYRDLPKPLHHYFENDVQPLDRDGQDR